MDYFLKWTSCVILFLYLRLDLDSRNLLVQSGAVEIPKGHPLRVHSQRFDPQRFGVQVFDLFVNVLGLETKFAKLMQDFNTVPIERKILLTNVT